MGLIDKVLKNQGGICESCGNLIKISVTTFACISNDKLILPDYPPYFKYGCKCSKWIKKDD